MHRNQGIREVAACAAGCFPPGPSSQPVRCVPLCFSCTQGTKEAAADLAATSASGSQRLYKDSVESMVRNFIQKQKIDMANEVSRVVDH